MGRDGVSTGKPPLNFRRSLGCTSSASALWAVGSSEEGVSVVAVVSSNGESDGGTTPGSSPSIFSAPFCSVLTAHGSGEGTPADPEPEASLAKLIAEKSLSLIPIEALVDPCNAPTPGTKAHSGILSSGGGTVVEGEAESAVTVRLATGSGGYTFSSDEVVVDTLVPAAPPAAATAAEAVESAALARGAVGALSLRCLCPGCIW